MVFMAAANQRVLAVIPARFASTRFPGKVLAEIGGKPLVVHTYLRACEAALLSEIVVATDEPRVESALRAHRVPCVMTRSDHPSGTDRIAEVAEHKDARILVNIQGDEPLIDPSTIDETVRAILDNPDISMSTARRLIADPDDAANPNVVKVVCDSRGRALYFSRHPIPYIRDEADRVWRPECHWQHIGLYAYRREFLLQFARWRPTPLEKLEKLEQLRALEHGCAIAVVETRYENIGVDTPEDLERVRALLEGALERRV
jgi:3-deoxy-manno-octulosonate cytidylyltransferase (CMP-KDO synthetase)